MDYSSNVKMLTYFIEQHLEFLTLKDICNLFLTNSKIYKLQTSFQFLAYIGRKCVDPANSYSKSFRSYFKKMLLRSKNDSIGLTTMQAKILRGLETKYVLSRNAILNSSGQYEFYGWKITENGGNKWAIEKDFFNHAPKRTCFVTSHGRCTMFYIVPIENFLTDKMTLETLMQTATFKAGCYIARRCDCPSHGEVSLTAHDAEENRIFDQKVFVSNQDMPVGTGSFSPYKKIELCFNPSKNEIECKSIKYLKLELYGQDDKFWSGHYGARFSDAYIRCYYQDVEGITKELEISMKDECKIALSQKYGIKPDEKPKPEPKKEAKKETKKPGIFGKWL